MVYLGPLPPEKEEIVFEDERDERAWVAFAAGYRDDPIGRYGKNNNTASASRFADNMLLELRSRRKPTGDGPYRE